MEEYVMLEAKNFMGDKYSGFAVVINRDTNQDDEVYINCALLQSRGKYRAGDYAWFLQKDTKISVLTDQQESWASGLYINFKEMHRASPYRIVGRLYEESPVFSDWDMEGCFPSYRPVPGSEREWKLDIKEAASTNQAAEWLLENHPDYWMGANIIQDCPSGDFSMHAVPCIKYGRGYHETYAGRYMFAKKEAKRRGIEAGPSEVLEKNAGDVSAPKMGKWLQGDGIKVAETSFYCSNCGWAWDNKKQLSYFTYCPNCKIEMEKQA